MQQIAKRRHNSQQFGMFISSKHASTSLFLFFCLFLNILYHIHLLLPFFQSVICGAFKPHQNSQPHYVVLDSLLRWDLWQFFSHSAIDGDEQPCSFSAKSVSIAKLIHVLLNDRGSQFPDAGEHRCVQFQWCVKWSNP